MLTTIIITICTCVFLIEIVLFRPTVTIHHHTINLYWIETLVGAFLIVATGSVSISEIATELTSNSSINPLRILILFISMTGLSIFLDRTGFFKYLAGLALSRGNSTQFKLFTYLFITVSILTVFTSNDIIILTFTPFICYFCLHASINPIPYLFGEFVAANTCSMALLIGNPTNIYLATSENISFIQYAKIMLLPTIAGGLFAYIILLLIFKNKLQKPLHIDNISTVMKDCRITNKPLMIIGLIHLTLCTFFLIISSYIGFEMYLIAFLFFVSLIICILIYCIFIRKCTLEPLISTLRGLPWQLIPFVLSMFIVVLALNNHGVTTIIGNFLGNSQVTYKYGFCSYLFANLINNIPMSVLFGSITDSLNNTNQLKGVFASVVGSNIGAYLSPIGALAGIMWIGICKGHEINFSFKTFIKYGVIISLPVMFITLFILDLVC